MPDDEKKGRLEKFWEEGGSGNTDEKHPPTEGESQKVPIFLQVQVAVKERCQQCGQFVVSHSTTSMPEEFLEGLTCNREQFVIRKLEESKLHVTNAIAMGRKCAKCGDILPI